MIDITPETVRLGFAGVNLLAFIIAVGLYARTPEQLRSYAAIAVLVAGFTPLVIVLQEFGVGTVTVGNGNLDILGLVQSVLSTVVIYGLVLASARVSPRIGAVTVALALIPTLGGEIFSVVGQGADGTLATVAFALFLSSFFIPFPALLYLFFVPIRRSTSNVAPEQRLLHWKARNILLFAYGMLLAYTPLAVVGLIADPVLDVFIRQYSVFFLYSGVVLYLLYNYTTLDTNEANTLNDYMSYLMPI